jgi:hypothetical protein
LDVRNVADALRAFADGVDEDGGVVLTMEELCTSLAICPGNDLRRLVRE